jgi:hypothetical protein
MDTVGGNPYRTPRWNDPVTLAHNNCNQTTHSAEQLSAAMLMGLGVPYHVLVYRSHR